MYSLYSYKLCALWNKNVSLKVPHYNSVTKIYSSPQIFAVNLLKVQVNQEFHVQRENVFIITFTSGLV